MVEIFDAYAKGDVFHAYYLYMTQSTPAAFYIVAMAIKDVKTGFTFCPRVVDRGENGLIFLGSNELTEKVILEENTEAYGMGGDDQFELKSPSGIGTVKIDGGAGSDTIDTVNAHREGLNYISGGGPERDTIRGGFAKDIISVDNDEVWDVDGDNVFLVEGSGNDNIQVGPGADLAIIKKSAGTVSFAMHQANHETRDQQKPKRIVYDSDTMQTKISLKEAIHTTMFFP